MSGKVDDMADERVPDALYWSVEDVANWVETIGFPQYKVRPDTFVKHLVYMATHIPLIGLSSPVAGIFPYDIAMVAAMHCHGNG